LHQRSEKPLLLGCCKPPSVGDQIAAERPWLNVGISAALSLKGNVMTPGPGFWPESSGTPSVSSGRSAKTGILAPLVIGEL
jgi:hypothetical protein